MFQVPVIGGRGYIIPHMAIYTTYNIITTYILPIGGLYATYHLLREPETTIEGISPRKSSFQIGCPTPVPAIRWPQSWRFLRCHSGWCWSLHPSRVNELSSIRQRLLSKDYIYIYITVPQKKTDQWTRSLVHLLLANIVEKTNPLVANSF